MKTHESITYELRNIGRCSYALITLTDLWEGAGTISIISDYGSWSYFWGSMGSDIRGFLSTTGTDYLMNKFTMDKREDAKHFNEKETLKQMREGILEAYKNEDISEETKDDALDDVYELEDRGMDSADMFATVVMESCNGLWHVFDCENMPLVKEYAPGLKYFMKEVWPVFIEEIRRDEVESRR